jgi:hypothetical protein
MRIEPKFPVKREPEADLDRPRFLSPRRPAGGTFPGWGPKLG